MATKWMTEAEFRKSPTQDAALRKSFAAEVKAEAGKPVRFCISTATPDRMGDVISVEGWKLDAYQKNPVVLWAHDRKAPPVAKATKVWIENAKLLMEMEFTARELYPFGAMVGDMVRGGFINASSVGFRPIKYAFNDARGICAMDFIEAELLENSIVPVPANAEALVEAKSAGIDLLPMVEWLEKSLDCVSEAGLALPRASLERAWAVVGRKATSVGKADDPAPSAPPPAAPPAAPEPDLKQIAAGLESLTASVSALTERVAALEEPDDEPEEEPTPAAPAESDDKAFSDAVERALTAAVIANAKALGIS